MPDATSEEGLTRAPDNYSLTTKLAQLELLNGDLDRAEELLQMLRSSYPGSGQLTNLGLTRMLKGDYAGAVQLFILAQQHSPTNSAVMLNLANSCDLLGDQTSAIRWYSAAIESSFKSERTDTPGELSTRAQCYAHLDRTKKSVETTQLMLRRAPDNPESHYSATLVYCLLGQRTAAEGSAGTALQLGMHPHWFELPWFDCVQPLDALQTQQQRK